MGGGGGLERGEKAARIERRMEDEPCAGVERRQRPRRQPRGARTGERRQDGVAGRDAGEPRDRGRSVDEFVLAEPANASSSGTKRIEANALRVE